MSRKQNKLLNELQDLKNDYDPGELPSRRSTRGVRRSTYLEQFLENEKNKKIREELLEGANELPDSDEDDDWVDDGDGADNASEYDSGPDSDEDDPDWDDTMEEKEEDDTEISETDDEAEDDDEEDVDVDIDNGSETEYEDDDDGAETVVLKVDYKKIEQSQVVTYDLDED
ncbi:hypothetical protein EXVG_00085 [Emiliania huxleyi virus 202]|nr:hypothetical protein EXVG_00085 [Emiliania huxleyi virus 202]AHA54461.1 hypothetical protein EhV18_00415 [Emiliania huxleyi virus 18]AHA55504.1 hypothetical protein EhV156_00409 [Emiliania huxleyi virus 156]